MSLKAVDACPERMDAAEAPWVETAVEFWSGVEARIQAAVDSCPDRMHLAALYSLL